MVNVVKKNMPLLSIRARGKWKDTFIFQVIHGKQFRRTCSLYDLSAKAHLVPYQPKFAAAVAAWQALTETEKRVYRLQAIRLGRPQSGYNRFISLYLKDRI